MKATLQVNSKLVVELNVENQQDLFESIYRTQEIFSIDKCGKCGSTDIKYIVRTIDDNKFFELQCPKCKAKLTFGCAKRGGGLFPHKKDQNNNWLPNNGWTVYTPSESKLQS